ncbi:hypothetical protein [Lutibacter sp.]
MSIKYELHSDSILVRNFIGKITAQEIIDSWEYIRENKLIDHKIKGIINNLSDCELIMNLESHAAVLSYMKKQDFLKGLKIAVLSDSPKVVIFPILAEQQDSLKIKPFSTFEAAVNWILLNLT